MPIHDWTRVRANRFHDFHQGWTIAICNSLNAGRLPAGYFTMVEQQTSVPEPYVITLDLTAPAGLASGGLAVDLQPPKTRFVARTEAASYARKANRITVRHPDGDVVAVIEIVSPGNKDSRHAIRAFARKAVEFLQAGVHLLIVDLFPPALATRRVSTRSSGTAFTRTVHAAAGQTADRGSLRRPDPETVAYVEPVAVGDPLPDMPVFLTADRYVLCPLEATYQTAWEQFPAPLRRPLESGPA